MAKLLRHVRFMPKPDNALLDHCIGTGEQQRGNVEAERSRRLDVDKELEPGRLNDRQVGRLFATENAADINPSFTVGVSLIRTVAQKSTRQSKFARIEH